MPEVTFGGSTYQVTSQGGYDYLTRQGTTYFYRQTGTTQWNPYQAQVSSSNTTNQASSSSGGTVPTQYSSRLEDNTYDGYIDSIRVRWGPAAQQRLLAEAPAKGISVATMKALTEHFTYQMADRVGATNATIKSPPKDFSVDSLTNAVSSDYEHITLELTGKKKVHAYITGKGSGSTAYDNITMTAGSVMTKQGEAGYAIDPNLSFGNYTMAGASTSASGAAAATTTAASSYGTTATSGAYPWEDDPQYQGYQQRWDGYKYDRRQSERE